MKRILMIATLGLLIVSCNKDQQAVKRLDGTWNATSYVETYGGDSEEYIVDGYGIKMQFENCKLKDDEFCTLTMTETYGGQSDSYTMEYRVAGGGTSLELREPDYPAELSYFEIKEFTKDKLELYMDYGDGDTGTIKLEKE